MHIIKEGKIENKNTIKFKCDKCGCEFECLEDEYWLDTSTCLTSYPVQYYIYASCPTCHKICRTTKTEKYESYSVTLDNGIVLGNKHIKKEILV